MANPQGIVENIAYFIDCFVNYENPPQDLQKMFVNLIIEYKKSVSVEGWHALITDNTYFANGFPNKLNRLYGL